MKIKANISFCGELTMKKGEERECDETMALRSLLKAGYVSEIKAVSKLGTKKEKGKKDKTDES